jgi:HK97 family phage major capsid protein
MKKKHYYSKRIKVLCWSLCILIAAMFATNVVQNGIKVNPTHIAVTTTLGLVPFALVQKLKDKGSYEKLDESTKLFVASLEKEINDALNEVSKGIPSDESIKTKYDAWLKENKGLLTAEQQKQFSDMVEAVKAQAIVIDQWKDKGLNKDDGSSPITKGLKENDVAIKAFVKSGRGAGKVSFEFTKAGGADQAATDIATHTIGLRVPGIGQLPVRKPFLVDLFPTVNCTLEYIKYIDQETVVRNAQNVASAGVTTHTTKLTWKERSIQITNVRDMVDVPIDMLSDYDFVEGELTNLLNVNVALKKDDQLLNGTGVNPQLHSIGEVASEFDSTNTLSGTITPWNNTIQAPNIFDLVIAMTSQIIALGQDGSFIPNAVLFNTIDRYKALLIKDKFDQYLMPPFVTRVGGKDYNIDGMVVRSNPNVPANSVWVLDSTKGTIYQRKAAVAEMSYENATNFETEVVTLKVYERLNLLIRNVNKNAFMKCTDVQTALVALTAP